VTPGAWLCLAANFREFNQQRTASDASVRESSTPKLTWTLKIAQVEWKQLFQALKMAGSMLTKWGFNCFGICFCGMGLSENSQDSQDPKLQCIIIMLIHFPQK